MGGSTFPLATLAGKIDVTGYSSPTFDDILSSLKASFQSIYGADVYLGADGQDGQWLAVLAAAIYDLNQMGLAVFSNQSPSYAVGAALSSLVKINGLLRHSAGNSTATVTITGVAGTLIDHGVVRDTNGNLWALPVSVTIPGAGTIDVTATCMLQGAVSAAAHAINNIFTPVAGWQTVDNTLEATVGAPIESDAELRKRQAQSTALPAQTPAESVLAAVANLPNVQRAAIYENTTGAADANGVPAHSIAVVVEGGDSDLIAQTIANKKTLGTGTSGATSVAVADPVGYTGTIHFDVLAYTEVYIAITVHPLTGWVTPTGDSIKQALADFINALAIGEDVYLTWLYRPGGLAGDERAATFKITSLQIGTSAGTVGSADMAIAFNAAARISDLAHIALTVA